MVTVMCISRYLEFEQPTPLGSQVVLDALHGAGQGDAPHQEDKQHDVGRHGRHVDHLARRLDALTQAAEDDYPGPDQAEQELPAEAAHVLNARRDLQHVVARVNG